MAKAQNLRDAARQAVETRGKKGGWRLCEVCKQWGIRAVAEYRAAQSPDQGKTVTWVYVCGGCIVGWNDGGDWDAPIIPLAAANKGA